MRGTSLKPNHRRIARTVGRVVLTLVAGAGSLTAALTTGVWITHHPEQFNASGDTLTTYAIGGAILALVAVDSLVNILLRPLQDRLEDDDLAADVIAYLAGTHAHALEISRAIGITVGSLFPVLAVLEDSGAITSYWAEPTETSTPRQRLYSLVTQA